MPYYYLINVIIAVSVASEKSKIAKETDFLKITPGRNNAIF